MLSRLLILIGLLVLSGSAAASVLDLPSTEKTAEWLNIVFNDDSILASMSSILNIGCLLFAGIMIGYTALTGVLNTAHEGDVMGKAYHSMWVPVRAVIALALLIPGPSGFSVAQYAVFGIAKAGAGLASSVWNVSLDQMDNKGTIYPPPSPISGERLAAAMLRNAGCLESLNRSHGEAVVWRDASTSQSGDAWRVSQRYTGSGTSLATLLSAALDGWDGATRMPVDVCGRVDLTFSRPDEEHVSDEPKKDYVYSVAQSLADLDAEVYQLARTIVNEDDIELSGDELRAMGAAYDRAVATALTDAVAALATAREADTNWSDEARELGFIGAGSFYLDIERLHAETFDFAAIEPTTAAPDPDNAENPDYRASMQRIASYLGARNTVNEYGDVVQASAQQDDDSIFAQLAQRVRASVRDASEGVDDPIAQLSAIGHGVISVVEVVGAGVFAADAAADAADSSLWLKLVPGAGAAGGAAASATEKLWTMFMFVGGLIIVAASMLAWYLPLIPWILWMLALAGWLVLVIEALVAAPVWAAAHSIPEGNSAVNNHARAGYMILLSLFMRPTLMLFGLFASFFVVILITKASLIAFIPAATSASGSNVVGVVSIVAYLVILASLMISIAHRAFGLIHEIPDKVLRYISGGVEQLGEASGEREGRAMLAGFMHRAERAGGRGMPRQPGGPGRGGNGGGDAPPQQNSVTVGRARRMQDQLSPAGGGK